ncbi:MAG: phosphatidylserine decarboxylase [Gammaproteobacteria bacterium]|nr:phosphatidylserine decarboxylase [Gammaproteobacteria bacterium]MDH5731650.1 phosphatidylserine decarboxylase [Gammaproteobacteria bacterium]
MASRRASLINPKARALLSAIVLFIVISFWFELFFLVGILSLLFFFLLFIFRDPVRKVPPAPLGVVSPVDAKVINIQQSQDPYLKREAWCISLRVNLSGVYSIRAPIEGKIHEQWQADIQKGIDYANWLQTDEGDNLVWSIRTRFHTHPSCTIQPGERIGQGQRCGFVLLSKYCHVYLPLGCRIEAQAGQTVLAGESIIATLIHNSQTQS